MSVSARDPNPSTQDHRLAPTTATPPTPGPRASRLQQVFDQALARILRANSYTNFAGCFPTPARYVPTSLESVWRQLNTKLEESAHAEFEDIIHERDAVNHLNELDRLVVEARERREREEVDGSAEGVVVPHTLSPEELYKAHLTPYLREAQKSLDTKIEDTQAQNEGLAKEVQAQRLEIQNLLAGLEDVVKDLEGAAEAASQFSAENDIHRENIQMDEEIRARPVI